MDFTPQNALESLLVRACEDAAARPQFYRDFAQATVLVVQHSESPAVEMKLVALGDGEKLGIRSIGFQGEVYLPVFSSLPRIEAFFPHPVHYLVIPVVDFMQATGGEAIFLNPGSPFAKPFTRQEVEAMQRGTFDALTVTSDAPHEIMVGEPAVLPEALLAALSRFFVGHREVERAYIAQFFDPTRDKAPHSLIALVADGDWEGLLNEVAVVAQGIELPNPPLDLMRLDGTNGAIEEYFAGVSPFYQRSNA